MAILTATAGADNLVGTAGDDTFELGDGTVQTGDGFDGGAGFDTLSFDSAASATWDFTGVSLLGFEAIAFNDLPDINANRVVIFTRSQFGAGGIADDLFLSGSLLSVERIRVNLSAGDIFSAAGWTFGEWSNDEITLNGSTGAEAITGSSKNDVINGLAGNDTLDGGAGADALVGGDGDDVYVVDNAGDTVTEGSGRQRQYQWSRIQPDRRGWSGVRYCD